jgi:hypothetical protein
MRIWDVPPDELCRIHLLGEHRELHAVWTILTQNKTGYRNHPETKRWEGKLAALYLRHDLLVVEMNRRGYVHRSDLDAALATGSNTQTQFVDTINRQRQLLKAKPCTCYSEAKPL